MSACLEKYRYRRLACDSPANAAFRFSWVFVPFRLVAIIFDSLFVNSLQLIIILVQELPLKPSPNSNSPIWSLQFARREKPASAGRHIQTSAEGFFESPRIGRVSCQRIAARGYRCHFLTREMETPRLRHRSTPRSSKRWSCEGRRRDLGSVQVRERHIHPHGITGFPASAGQKAETIALTLLPTLIPCLPGKSREG